MYLKRKIWGGLDALYRDEYTLFHPRHTPLPKCTYMEDEEEKMMEEEEGKEDEVGGRGGKTSREEGVEGERMKVIE